MIPYPGLGEPEFWLAAVRVGTGAWFLKSVFHKSYPDFISHEMAAYVADQVQDHPLAWYHRFITGTVLPYAQLWARLVVLGELLVGGALVLGLLTPLAAVAGIAMNSSYLLLTYHRSHAEQGQNYLMILGQAVTLLSGAGMYYGLDAVVFAAR